MWGKYIRKIIKYAAVFAAGVLACWGLLIFSCRIPRQLLLENLERSVSYYEKYEMFFQLEEGKLETQVDYYADENLYNIIASMDRSDPVRASLDARYCRTWMDDSMEGMKRAVAGEEANQSYARYWHGSLSILTPLLLVTDAEGIYQIVGAVLLLLLGLLLLLLWRAGDYEIIGALLIAILACRGGMILTSLEYMMSPLAALLAANLLLLLDRRGKDVSSLWILSGLLVCYLDFLTTETMALLLPLLIWTIHRFREGMNARQCLKGTVRAGMLWGGGYVSMWLAKWLLSSLVLQRNVLLETVPQAAFRINSNAYMRQGTIERLLGALARNLRCVRPLVFADSYGEIFGMTAFLLLALGTLGYLFHRKKRELQIIPVLLLIGAVPYLRYLVLSAHSYVHCFFTYRAQLISVMAVLLSVWYAVKKK